MAVTRQPGQFSPSEFQTGLCDICDDWKVCLCGAFCHLCLTITIANDMDECCLCGIGMPIRSVYRTKYNINGSMCNDYLTTCFCMSCASCQLKRDIKRRQEQGIF
ncbi:placenta-specific gene 8 protein-like [Synchiropus picturatus]